MEIEIVEFYPDRWDKKKRIMGGTLHVYLIDYDLDVRGVVAQFRGKEWFISPLMRGAIDPDTKNNVYYPVICFANTSKQKEFMSLLIKQGREYIHKYLKRKEATLKIRKGWHKTKKRFACILTIQRYEILELSASKIAIKESPVETGLTSGNCYSEL